jgi:Fic family protein
MASRKDIANQLEAIRTALATFADGALIDQVEAACKLGLSRRTLQRRLEVLIDRGVVISAEQGRATRYHLVRDARTEPPTAQGELFVPVSQRGADIQAFLRRPPEARPVVAYRRVFLDAYRPNATSYLSTAERTHLMTVGRPSIEVQAAGTYAKNILNRLLIDLSWSSSRLEGNTYSLLDTKRLIDLGQEAEGKDRRETQMILNHKEAIEFLVTAAEDIGFNRFTILNLHALLANNLLDDPRSPGRLRTIIVGIDGSPYHPSGVPQLIEECFDEALAKAAAIEDPFEQAFFTLVQLPYLQPFDDVNKRVSRLAANIPFIKQNLCPLSFIDVPKDTYTEAMLGVYELNDVALLRDVFLWAYERSASRYAAVRQQLGEPDPFRLRNRAALKALIADIVRSGMDKKTAPAHIAKWVHDNIATADRERFRDIAESELVALHEGNFARYQVRPSEFARWQRVWSAS